MSFSRSFVSIGIPSRGIPQVYHTFPFCPEKKIAPVKGKGLASGFVAQAVWGKHIVYIATGDIKSEIDALHPPADNHPP
jgi:hypothetical protein